MKKEQPKWEEEFFNDYGWMIDDYGKQVYDLMFLFIEETLESQKKEIIEEIENKIEDQRNRKFDADVIIFNIKKLLMKLLRD